MASGRAWAEQCAPDKLWRHALQLLGGAPPWPRDGGAGGARKSLFGEDGAKGDEVAVIMTAMRRCGERNSPFALWSAAKNAGNKELGRQVLEACSSAIGLLPPPWRAQYGLEVAGTETQGSSVSQEEVLTPTKKILLAGNTGGEAAVRRHGSRVSNNRERLRDALSVLFLEPQSVKLKCTELLSWLEPDNEVWFCECLLDVYLRFCNKLAEHERCMIDKKATMIQQGGGSGEKELAVVRVCCEALFDKHLHLWQQMCCTLMQRIESLRGETYELYLVATELSHVARFLSVVTFLGVRQSTAHVAQLGVAHSLFAMVEESVMEEDPRQIVLLLVVLDQFLELVPLYVSLGRVGKPAARLAQRLRASCVGTKNLGELFVFAKCNNILSSLRVATGGSDLGGSALMDDFESVSKQMSHSLFMRHLLLSWPDTEQQHLTAAANASQSPSSGAPVFSSNQETKYWFFKMQNALLKLVSVVAHSVANNAVHAVVAESVQQVLEGRGDRFEGEESEFCELAFLKCQHLVKKDCAELLPRLAPRSTDDAVLRRAVNYTCEAALQICYDSIGDAVRAYVKTIKPRHSVSAPAIATGEQQRQQQPRFVNSVLQSPFLKEQEKAVAIQTRRQFAMQAGMPENVALEGLDEPCDDWTEFFLFLLLVANYGKLEELTLTSEQRAVLDACRQHVPQ